MVVCVVVRVGFCGWGCGGGGVCAVVVVLWVCVQMSQAMGRVDKGEAAHLNSGQHWEDSGPVVSKAEKFLPKALDGFGLSCLTTVLLRRVVHPVRVGCSNHVPIHVVERLPTTASSHPPMSIAHGRKGGIERTNLMSCRSSRPRLDARMLLRTASTALFRAAKGSCGTPTESTVGAGFQPLPPLLPPPLSRTPWDEPARVRLPGGAQASLPTASASQRLG